jgi:hypothetical protein
MFHHRAETICAPIEQVLVGSVDVVQQVFLDDALVERRAGHRTVNQELRQCRFGLHQAVMFLRHNFRSLIIKPDNHGSQHGDAVIAKLLENLGGGPALLLGVVGARSLVADPEPVNAHLQNFLHGVLTDGLDAGEREDRKLLPTACITHSRNSIARFLLSRKSSSRIRNTSWGRGRSNAPRRRKCPCPSATA